MKTLARIGLAALVASLFASAPLPSAEAVQGVNLGTLTCNTIPGLRTNLLFSSSVPLRCVYRTHRGEEQYRGEIGHLGIDLSKKGMETLRFTVVGLTADTAVGAHTLSGGYVGTSVSVGLAKGFGSTQLVGVSRRSISLVPSFDTFDGIGLTAGLSRMTLEAK